MCGRSRIYKESQSTSGIETLIQRIVRFDAVWHHDDSLISEGEGGAAAAMVLETARLASDFEVGEELRSLRMRGEVGAGDAVEVRDARLVGESSGAGKSPRG